MSSQRQDKTTSDLRPRITFFSWNLVDKPWDFYGVRYILNDRYDHIVYIPARAVEEELKEKDIVQIVVDKLDAVLDCEPIHHDRITREMKYEYVKEQFGYQKRYQARKLDESGASDGKPG